jgi:DNA-binding CsgD family transcriptional regulator
MVSNARSARFQKSARTVDHRLTGPERLGGLREAAETFAAVGFTLDECSTRLILARELIALRSLDEAATEAHRAKTIADTCGARFLYGQAVNIQRRIGACRPRTATAESTLTMKETEIARLVSMGMSNQAIAQTLHVAVKTVEAHLTRIYRKLGTPSRAALAALFPRTRGESEQ